MMALVGSMAVTALEMVVTTALRMMMAESNKMTALVAEMTVSGKMVVLTLSWMMVRMTA